MATKKLSEALKALTTPEFGAEVEMPALSLNGTTIMPTGAELNYVDGVTSNIQTQLNAKAAATHVHAGADVTSGTLDGDRLPAMSPTKKGAVPLSTTSTGSQVLADNGWKKINNLYSAFGSLTIGDTTVWDVSAVSYNQLLALTQTTVLNITNMSSGMSGCLIVTQSSNYILLLPANSIFPDGDYSNTKTAGAVDMLTWVYNGTTFLWTASYNFSA